MYEIYIQWNGYQCILRHNFNQKIVVDFMRKRNSLLGKGKLHVTTSVTNSTVVDLQLVLKKHDETCLQFLDNKFFLYCDWEEISRTETIECLLLLCFERAMHEDGIVSVHASCVSIFGDGFLFIGPREAGKTSVSYNLCKNYNAQLACNDYIWLKVKDNQVIAYNGDGKDKIAFRSHALAQLDDELYKKLYNSNLDAAFNVRKKIPVGDLGIEICSKEIPIKKIFSLGLGHSATLESKVEDSIKAKVTLYENFCGLLRGNEMVLYDSDKNMNTFIPDISTEKTHKNVHKLINVLVENKKVHVLRGGMDDIVKEVFRYTRCKDD